TAPPQIYTLSLHDALPIFVEEARQRAARIEAEARERVSREQTRLRELREEVDRLLRQLRRLTEAYLDSPAPGEALNRRPDSDERSEEHTSELQSRENLVCR